MNNEKHSVVFLYVPVLVCDTLSIVSTTLSYSTSLISFLQLITERCGRICDNNSKSSSSPLSGRDSDRSASNSDLVVQSTRLKLGDRAFYAAGPCAWNRLPTELKAINGTRVFRHKLKSFFSVRIPLTHTNIVLGHQSIVGGNIDCIIVLYCIVQICSVV